MPKWYAVALANRHNPSASIAFAKEFLTASPEERAEVVDSWDRTLEWPLPNPWRLACIMDKPGTPYERIRTALLFLALDICDIDTRESIAALALIYNSCRLSGINPNPVFEEIAGAVDGAASGALRSFASRSEADQSMDAFMLEAIADPGGGYEIKANW